MKKGIILFDIDKTLYNPEVASKEHNDAVIKLLGTTDTEKYYEVKEKYKKTLKQF